MTRGLLKNRIGLNLNENIGHCYWIVNVREYESTVKLGL